MILKLTLVTLLLLIIDNDCNCDGVASIIISLFYLAIRSALEFILDYKTTIAYIALANENSAIKIYNIFCDIILQSILWNTI